MTASRERTPNRTGPALPRGRCFSGRPRRGRRPRHAPIAWVSGLLLLASLGCAENWDLIEQYDLQEIQGALLIQYPTYRNTGVDLKKPPPGTGHWIRDPKLEILLGSLTEVPEADQPPEAEPAFALVLFPDEELTFKCLLIDQYLNILPGFQFLGEMYAGPYGEAPDAFKCVLLDAISTSARSTRYHVSLLGNESKPGTAGKEGEDGP